MARIPEAELERLKRETDLVALVQAAGVELRRHGANLVGRCPFHEDRGPSLVVTPGKNLWHCLGACQAGGSVFDWVMRSERVSFRHAVELVRQRDAASPGERPQLAPLVAPTRRRETATLDDQTLLRQVIDFYHETLVASPEAIAYLERRGLNAVELIDHFHLGYANRTLGYRLPKKALKAGAELRSRLQTLGILRPSGHEHFWGSLVVPIFGERGQLVQCYGRKLRDDLRDGTPLHLYLPGPHTGVWNIDALASSKEVILCEALLDAMTFWVAGHRHVITSYGVSGFTDAHRAALRRYGTERVVIAYDGDEAGERGAERIAEELTQMGVECYRVHFPRGLDANAYALAHPPAGESLGALLRGATWLGRSAPIVAVAGDSSLTAAVPNAASSTSSLAADASALTAPTASPVSMPAVSPLALERHGEELSGALGDRCYRVRGLAKNLSPDALRVNVLVRRGEAVHVDTLDLYAARARALFVSQAAKELDLSEDVVKKDVGALFLALEPLVTAQITAALAPPTATVPVMSEAERDAALAFLRDPQLLDRILADFEAVGVVGEETNKLVGYVAAISRKLPEPLAVIIQSASAAGKTSLMDAILAFLPNEERVQYSAMTGQALFYMAETNLTHKVLAVVEEAGAERASYALKLLQSEGELTIASTGKDPETGKLVTHEYHVQGPVMIMLTTTAVDLDEELVNRALVLTVDETPAQTRAIHRLQRAKRTLDGLISRETRHDVLTRHQHAQRLLEPVHVVNPHAPELTFVDARTRTRRDHEKYLTLIDAIALLHQHQRERKTIAHAGRLLTYIEVTPEDIAIANRLAAAVLGRSLDELPPQTRAFLEQFDTWVSEQCRDQRTPRRELRFLAREVREALGTGATQTKVHLRRLVDLEYVLLHRAPRGQGVAYELAYSAAADAASETICFSGLHEIPSLGAGQHAETPERSARELQRSVAPRDRSGLGRPVVGAESGAGRPTIAPPNVPADTVLSGAAVLGVTPRGNGHRPRHGHTILRGGA